MIQVPGVTVNGRPFVCDERVAVLSDGRVIALEDRPLESRWGR